MQHYIDQIAKDGFCLIPQLLSPEETQHALTSIKAWREKTRNEIADDVPFLNQDQDVVYNLQNKDPYFLDVLFGKKEVDDLLIHFLNDPWFKQIPQDEANYILRGYIGRSSCGGLPMHIDSMFPHPGHRVITMQVVYVLEDMNAENGCTLVVPGSHLSGEYVTQDAADIAIPVEAKAGDVILWDSRIWHGTTANVSDRTRWTLIASYSRWWLKQSADIPASLPQDVYDRLTTRQKSIMGFSSIPYKDETYGIDMKRGDETLLPEVAGYR